MKTACVFTGHRQLNEDFEEKKLENAIRQFLEEGVTCFYNGGAIGFDLLAAEKVLSFKENFPNIKLILCVPCQKQSQYFSPKEKERYQNVLTQADEVILLSEKYYRGCMQVRDRYMVDKADCMIAYCNKEEGGTAYTVRYFQKKNPEKEILFI